MAIAGDSNIVGCLQSPFEFKLLGVWKHLGAVGTLVFIQSPIRKLLKANETGGLHLFLSMKCHIGNYLKGMIQVRHQFVYSVLMCAVALKTHMGNSVEFRWTDV